MTRSKEATHARMYFEIAFSLVAVRADTATLRQAAALALDDPTPATVQAALLASDGTPWKAGLADAMVQVGIAGASLILGKPDG